MPSFIHTLILLALLFGVSVSTTAYASNSHSHDKKPHGHEEKSTEKTAADAHDHDDEERVQIDPAIAEKVGIVQAVAAPGEINVSTLAYGRLQTLPDHLSVVRARFPGIVTQVNVQQGDTVSKGSALASIESNDSLQTYTVRAAINGTVQQRHINAGEFANEQTLFVIADQDELLAELNIFPRQRTAVRAGQTVLLNTETASQQSRISRLLPSDDGNNHLLAQVLINNSDGVFAAGDLVSAAIITDQAQVAVRVDKRALQTVENHTVVFVLHDNEYEPREVKLGRSDAQFAEITEGLAAGETYVAINSYLIKAQLEKSGAEHSH